MLTTGSCGWLLPVSTWTNNQLVTPKFDNWMMTWQLASHQPLKRQHIDVALEYDLWTKVNDHWLNKINFLILLELLELLELLSNCFFVFWLFQHTWPNATSDLLIFPNELHLALVQMAFTQATIDNMAIKQGMDLLETKGWSPWSASWPTMRSRTSAKSSGMPEEWWEICWPLILALHFWYVSRWISSQWITSWGMQKSKPECSGNLHHPQCCPHHEDASRMGGRSQRCGSPSFGAKDWPMMGAIKEWLCSHLPLTRGNEDTLGLGYNAWGNQARCRFI